MPHIWIIHADPKLGAGLQTGLRQAWPDMAVETAMPGTLTALPQHDVAVVQVPDERFDARYCVVMGEPQRLKTLIRRIQACLQAVCWPANLALGDCFLNTRTREWTDGADRAVMLTEKEVDLLVYLWQRRHAASREDLLRDVWDYASGVDTHTIETHIYRLRQKIETDPASPNILLTTKDGYQLNQTLPS